MSALVEFEADDTAFLHSGIQTYAYGHSDFKFSNDTLY